MTLQTQTNQQITESKKNNSLEFCMPNAQEMTHLISFCKVMSECPFYAKLGPGGVMAIFLTAKERNLPFMACLNGGLYNVEGKITYSAIMVHSMILNAGHDIKILHLDGNSCKLKFIRGDKGSDSQYQPLIYEYSMEDARIAGYLTKNNWKNSPKDMLFSRCIMGGARKHMPEIMMGILVAGELTGTNLDGDISPMLGEITCNASDTPIEEKKAIPECTDHEYDEFFATVVLEKNLDAVQVGKFIDEIVSNDKNFNRKRVVCSAIKNKERFFDSFNKWYNEKLNKG